MIKGTMKIRCYNRVRAAIERRRRRQVVNRFRPALAIYGIDVAGLSDDEILERMTDAAAEFAIAMRKVSITSGEMAEQMRRLSASMKVGT